jgi:hypothetical protein
MVLCDLLNTPQVDQLYARRQLLKFFARAAGIAFRPQLALPPGKYHLRLGVVDMSNGRIGTLDVPFTVKASGSTTKAMAE